MRMRLVSLGCVCCLVAPHVSGGQTLTAPPSAQLPAPTATDFWAPFKTVPQDFANLLSSDTARIAGIAAAGFVVGHRWDDDGVAVAASRFKPVSRFTFGNVGGSMPAQLGGAFAVYSIARATGHERAAEVGSDLIRAQVLSQALVQSMKFAFLRDRPDGSNRLSFPSGHTAGAMATATVLTRHFGWKAGIPAYTAGAYVAASRMAANRHHITDVMVGAAVGIIAGRTVTVGTSGHRFAVGVSPTVGGAAITFTRK